MFTFFYKISIADLFKPTYIHFSSEYQW